MAKNVQLLLTETVENLGIVGDVVKVKPGHARNFLLPTGVAVPPSPSKIEALKEARARAQAELAAIRTEREKLITQMTDVTVELARSCNDQGVLYGSVTQRDIADALQEAGYGVDVRAVRLSHAIRHIGSYTVPIQFERDLRADITAKVKSDRELEEFTALGEVKERVEQERPAGEHARGPRRRHPDEGEIIPGSDYEEQDEKRDRRDDKHRGRRERR